MNKIEKDMPETAKILKMQCKVVGADYGKIDFKSPNWFLTYEWSTEDQEKFRKEFVKYLLTHAKARKEIMANPSKNKKLIEKVSYMWMLDFGWKNKVK